MKFEQLNRIVGWIVFCITFLVYSITAQRTISFWDSPEFISAAFKLQVSHPPGAPLYAMLVRLFMSVFPKSMIAFAGSLFSVVCAAFTILFLYWCVTLIAKKLISKKSETLSSSERIAVIASGFIGSLSLVFTHSYWIASTEAEVYTLSTVLLAIGLWITLKWEGSINKTESMRWFLLLALILGLSVGVHIMNLGIAFPIAMIFILKKYGWSIKNLLLGFGSGLGLFILMKNIIINGFLNLSVALDMFLVNKFDMPFNSGMFLALVLFIGLISLGLYQSRRRKKILIHHILLGLILFMIGWSSYGLAVVRSLPNLPISSEAGNPLRLNSYLNAEQFDFGRRPLFKGPSFNAPLDANKPFLHGDEIYAENHETSTYEQTNDGKYTVTNFDKRFDMYFPRMYSPRQINIKGYYNWVDIKGSPIKHSKNGKTETLYKPTLGENLTYFFKYQFGHLNLRYFLWNYVGSQNRNFGSGDPLNGNWMSGLGFIDFGRIGNTGQIPKHFMQLKSMNNFYFLPLLLGLFGLIFLFLKDKSLFAGTLFFFLAFSLAITIFINQMAIHLEIRDRDYVFLGAYFIFSLWIGLGVLGLFKLIPMIKENNTKAWVIATLTFLLVPFQMGAKGWDDHNRSQDDFIYRLAKAYLDACGENALLITTGDNATFPLWYLQEVEGYRTDVRVINYELLNIDHYIDKLRYKINASEAVNMSLSRSAYVNGVDKLLPLINKVKQEAYADVSQLVDFVSSDNKTLWNGRNINYFPTTRFSLRADTSKLREKGINPEQYQCDFIASIDWEYSKDFYSIADLVLLDILSSNNWERPICFTNLDYYDHFIGLNRHCIKKGMVNELLPITPSSNKTREKMFDIETMKSALIDDNELTNFSTDKYYRYEARDIARSVFRPSYFFLADAYLELGDIVNTERTLDRCLENLPDKNVQFRKYMFDVGKLYYKIDKPNKAKLVIGKLVDNLFKETHHFLSFSPANKFITRTRSRINTRIIGIVTQELQAYDKELAIDTKSKHQLLERELESWLTQNFD